MSDTYVHDLTPDEWAQERGFANYSDYLDKHAETTRARLASAVGEEREVELDPDEFRNTD